MRRLILALLAGFAPVTVSAGEAWDDIRPQVFAERTIAPGDGVITLTAPYRTSNDLRTPLGAEIALPDGQRLRRVTLIIDENPMPVSAVVTLADPAPGFRFTADMRMNGPSPVRVVAETEDGQLYMTEMLVKTSGTGACAAPPSADPAVAALTLGNMDLALVDARAPILASLTHAPQRVRVEVDHPSSSGMQKDQISLLFIPARYIATLDVATPTGPLFQIEGSISLAEDPGFVFDLPDGAVAVTVRMTDTDGAISERAFALVEG